MRFSLDVVDVVDVDATGKSNKTINKLIIIIKKQLTLSEKEQSVYEFYF